MLANIKNFKQAFLVNLEDFEVPRNAAVYNLGLISNSSHSALSEDSDKR
jgi:hypothetical protein